jgi:3-phytase
MEYFFHTAHAAGHGVRAMRYLKLVTITSAAILAGCSQAPGDSNNAPTAAAPAIAAQLATEQTFRHAALDAALWIDTQEPAKSLLLVSGGEGGLEIDELSGRRAARFETVEAGFIDVRQNVASGSGAVDLVIASDQRQGAVRVYAFDAPARRIIELTGAPIEIDDAITGLCTFRSSLTQKLYAFVATDQGQLEQWELFLQDGKARGQLVRRIAAGKGASHCVADDQSAAVYFSEESVGIWRVAAEPESDAARTPVDLIEPRGTLHEEVKGLALYRGGSGSAHLVAADAGAGTFNIYDLDGKRAGTFSIQGKDLDVGDAEGLLAAADPLGNDFPQGALIVADEGAGNYKIVAWNDIAQALSLAKGESSSPPAAHGVARTVQPKVETEPADSYGDSADDPAIWVDRRDPSRSVVIGTDKKLGLNVYDLKGKRLQVVPDGRMNNVDLREGFMLAGKPTTIVAATNRTTRSISLCRFDPAARRLASIADGMLETGMSDPYGLCMYRSAKSGDYFVIANDSVDGKYRQWRVLDRNGKAAIELVREIAVGSQAEGCAADDELGQLYIAEEDVGLWAYSAEPSGGQSRMAVDKTEGGNLTADVEGVAIYYGENGKGYVIASNQGEDDYAVYRREAPHAFVGKFHVVANEALGIDGSSETDGLDVVSAPLGADYPAGMLVVQDGRNLMPAQRQNFKYVSWQDVMQALE